MASKREEDEQGRSGLVRVVDDEDDDENGNGGNGDADPFATGGARPGTVTPRRPNPGNGNGEDELRAEVARLRSENVRLRAVAGLEGRREEPATVGDLLDVNAVQAGLIRDEVARVIDEHGEAICDAIAERVEERLLDTVAPDDDEDGGKGGKAGAARRGKKVGKTPGPRNVHELEGPYTRDGERGLWYVDEQGNWFDEDGTPA